MFELELRSQINMLSGMRLNSPYDDLIPNITKFYERKIDLWQRMSEIASEFIGGPKEGVDYNKLAAEMPKIRAELEFVDQGLFEATLLVFATLIDMKEDSKGHASHLIITKEEKAKLIEKLNNSFGAKMGKPKWVGPLADFLRAPGRFWHAISCTDRTTIKQRMPRIHDNSLERAPSHEETHLGRPQKGIGGFSLYSLRTRPGKARRHAANPGKRTAPSRGSSGRNSRL